ncbi:hypothetical protein ILYODFUR_010299 [Ilyodon furcidens]|uniref:Uncharacterized protein n=1 Tax=Ilyodon furcidens TaxID=33524 RepID=A0ABV0THS5_9TELE
MGAVGKAYDVCLVLSIYPAEYICIKLQRSQSPLQNTVRITPEQLSSSNIMMPQRLCVPLSVSVCLCMMGRDVHKRFSHFRSISCHGWWVDVEAKAFENKRQNEAGGGDRASGNLDSPVVYL